jgi:hypothetical protein
MTYRTMASEFFRLVQLQSSLRVKLSFISSFINLAIDESVDEDPSTVRVARLLSESDADTRLLKIRQRKVGVRQTYFKDHRKY